MSARLFYLMGASGSGKDSLLHYVRTQLPADARVAFAHRYITRAADAGGENHVSLTPQEYAARLAHGLFALAWSSHGLQYAVGSEIHSWLARGVDVVVNGSRAYLQRADEKFPQQLQPILVEVDAAVLAKRLRQRGREAYTEIAARLARSESLDATQTHRRLIRLDNNGELKIAGDQLLRLLTEHDV